MIMQDWIKKILAVIFLTLLIWAWAFLSQEAENTWVVTLKPAPAALPDFMITFSDGQNQVDNLRLTLKGTPGKISELNQRIRNEKPEFYYNPKEFGHNTDNDYRLDMTEYFRNHPTIKEYALTLKSCQPERIDVHVEKLTPKLLVIQCVDENGSAIKHESIEPAQVEVPVRREYIGSAYVMLTVQQAERARRLAIEEKPYVEITPGKRRYAQSTVKITLPASEPLKEQVIQPMIGYTISPALVGKYKIELVNESELKTIRNIRATDKAFEAYKKQRYHILIEIRDGDEALTEIPPRPIFYNFPPEFQKDGQIEAPNPPQQAQIKLTPQAAPAAPTTATTLLPAG
jgi:hypothetical protein